MPRAIALATKLPLLTLLPLLLLATASFAGGGHFTESFDTTQYKSGFTTADWDTVVGELKLLPFAITSIGSYDTPGTAEDLCLEGNYLYVADGSSGVQVLDVTLPATPTLAGGYVTPGGAAGLAAAGDLLYVAAQGSGLQILDISDPTTPLLLGNLVTNGFSFDVAVSGDYAYVANSNQPVSVIDVSDPALPVQVATVPVTSFAQGVAVDGSFLFVADGYSGLAIVEIFDPTAPVVRAYQDTPGFARNVVVEGNIAYVADHVAGLQVIDVTSRWTPVSLGSFATSQPAVGLFVDGDWLYLASTDKMHILNISDPSNLIRHDEWSSPGDALAVVVSGENAYLADGATGGVQIVQAANVLTEPIEAYVYPVGVTCTPAIAGNYLYVGRTDPFGVPGGYEILTFDMTDPTTPAYRGARGASGYPQDMAVSGDLLYVAQNTSGLVRYSLINPTSPNEGSFYDPASSAIEVAVAGNTVFGGFWDSTLRSVDAQTRSLLSSYPLPDRPLDILLQGDALYAPCGTGGLQIIDISDPAALALAGQYVPTGGVWAVAVQGNLAYIASSDGVHVVDVSDPTSPTWRLTLNMNDGPAGIALVGNQAIVASPSGLHVVDITNPNFPYFAGSTLATLSARELVPYGDQLLVGDYSSSAGFRIFRMREREFDVTNAIGHSIGLTSSGPDIHRARLVSDQDDAVRWELSNYSTSDFQEVTANGNWIEFLTSHRLLMWRATLLPITPGVNPTVRDLSIDWLFHEADIDSIVDVPNDQGGVVRLHFTRSGHDFADESTYPAASYTIYRRADDPVLKQRVAVASASLDVGRTLAAGVATVNRELSKLETVSIDDRKYVQGGPGKAAGFPPGLWESITSLGALQSDNYLSLVPTLADSGAVVQSSVYVVVTHTTTPAVWYVSEPDSGSSVDNIAPGVPQGFTAAYADAATALNWLDSPEPDFQYYRVYRGSGDGFVPSPANLVHATATTAWVDPVSNPWQYRYKITAVDHAGNESDPASPDTATDVETPPMPARFTLHPNVPNPFNPRTTISYSIPRAGHVELEIYDLAGRHVAALVSEHMGIGEHRVQWNGKDDTGAQVASGVYLYQLRAADFVETKRMVLLK